MATELTPSRRLKRKLLSLSESSPTVGGNRQGSGRPRLYVRDQSERDIRVYIPRELHQVWVTYKTLVGCRTDREFAKFLLDLAGKHILTTPHQESQQQPNSPAWSYTTYQGHDKILTSTPVGIHDSINLSQLDDSTLAANDSPLGMGDNTLNDIEHDKTINLAKSYLVESGSEDSDLDTDDTESIDLDASIMDPASLPISSCHITSTRVCADLEPLSDASQPLPSQQSSQQQSTSQQSAFLFSISNEFEDLVKCKKVLVNISNLLALAQQKCHRPDCSEVITTCTPTVTGCSIKLVMTCKAKHFMEWYSCPQVKSAVCGVIPANNLLEAASILLSGSHYAKVFMKNRILNAHCISESTYYRYQRQFLVPAVDKYWLTHQGEVVSRLEEREALVVAGDGRCDSPGNSAKYCSYTLMDTDTHLVLHSVTVDKREVGGKSPNMEREALFRCLTQLTKHVQVKEIVTDASTSVKAMLETNFPNIIHSMDVWHKSKKLRKALAEVGRLKANKKILDWSSNIVNHFWYCSKSCEGDEELLRGKHEWLLGKCVHDELTDGPKDENGKQIEYFSLSEPATENLKAIVLDKKLLQSLSYYVNFRHTGALESLHSAMLMYCPKRVQFRDGAYAARMQLAMIDHNHHLSREKHISSSTNEIQYRRVFRKASKKWDAVPVLEKKDYAYMPSICKSILELYHEFDGRLVNQIHKRDNHPDLIAPHIANVEPPSTASIVKSKHSRF